MGGSPGGAMGSGKMGGTGGMGGGGPGMSPAAFTAGPPGGSMGGPGMGPGSGGPGMPGANAGSQGMKQAGMPGGSSGMGPLGGGQKMGPDIAGMSGGLPGRQAITSGMGQMSGPQMAGAQAGGMAGPPRGGTTPSPPQMLAQSRAARGGMPNMSGGPGGAPMAGRGTPPGQRPGAAPGQPLPQSAGLPRGPQMASAGQGMPMPAGNQGQMGPPPQVTSPDMGRQPPANNLAPLSPMSHPPGGAPPSMTPGRLPPGPQMASAAGGGMPPGGMRGPPGMVQGTGAPMSRTSAMSQPMGSSMGPAAGMSAPPMQSLSDPGAGQRNMQDLMQMMSKPPPAPGSPPQQLQQRPGPSPQERSVPPGTFDPQRGNEASRPGDQGGQVVSDADRPTMGAEARNRRGGGGGGAGGGRRSIAGNRPMRGRGGGDGMGLYTRGGQYPPPAHEGVEFKGGLNDKYGKVDLTRVNPELINRMNRAYDAMPENMRDSFKLNAGFRPDYAKEGEKLGIAGVRGQDQAYAATKGSGPVAKPGGSQHRYGQAVDVAAGPARDWLNQHGKEYGLGFPIKGDPPHMQARSDYKPIGGPIGAGLDALNKVGIPTGAPMPSQRPQGAPSQSQIAMSPGTAPSEVPMPQARPPGAPQAPAYTPSAPEYRALLGQGGRPPGTPQNAPLPQARPANAGMAQTAARAQGSPAGMPSMPPQRPSGVPPPAGLPTPGGSPSRPPVPNQGGGAIPMPQARPPGAPGQQMPGSGGYAPPGGGAPMPQPRPQGAPGAGSFQPPWARGGGPPGMPPSPQAGAGAASAPPPAPMPQAPPQASQQPSLDQRIQEQGQRALQENFPGSPQGQQMMQGMRQQPPQSGAGVASREYAGMQGQGGPPTAQAGGVPMPQSRPPGAPQAGQMTAQQVMQSAPKGAGHEQKLQHLIKNAHRLDPQSRQQVQQIQRAYQRERYGLGAEPQRGYPETLRNADTYRGEYIGPQSGARAGDNHSPSVGSSASAPQPVGRTSQGQPVSVGAQAHNPQTGEVVQFTGKGWEPMAQQRNRRNDGAEANMGQPTGGRGKGGRGKQQNPFAAAAKAIKPSAIGGKGAKLHVTPMKPIKRFHAKRRGG